MNGYLTWNSRTSCPDCRRLCIILNLIACSKHIRVTVNRHVEASHLALCLHHTPADAKNADHWIYDVLGFACLLAVFILVIALRFSLHSSCASFKLYLCSGLRLIAFCLVLQFPWRSGFLYLFWPFAMVSAYALPFCLLLWTFDPLTSTFLGSCPSVELLIFDCRNAVTQRGHQLLAGFRFEATEALFILSLLNLKASALGYLLSC